MSCFPLVSQVDQDPPDAILEAQGIWKKHTVKVSNQITGNIFIRWHSQFGLALVCEVFCLICSLKKYVDTVWTGLLRFISVFFVNGKSRLSHFLRWFDVYHLHQDPIIHAGYWYSLRVHLLRRCFFWGGFEGPKPLLRRCQGTLRDCII